jgi:DNA-binding CsgD family transcriptional regulator
MASQHDPQQTIIASAMAVACAGCALLMAGFGKQITYIIRYRSLQLTVGIVFCATFTVYMVAQWFDVFALSIITALICGFLSAFFLLLWGEAYRRRDASSVSVDTALALAVSLVCFILLWFVIPTQARDAVLCLLPLVQEIFLFVALHGVRAFRQRQHFSISSEGTKIPDAGLLEIPTFHRLRVNHGKLLLRLGAPILCTGFAFGFIVMRTVSPVVASDNSPDEQRLLFYTFITAAIIIVALVLLPHITYEHMVHTPYYHFLLPVLLMLAFFTLCPVISELYVSVSLGLLCCCVFQFILWTRLTEFSQEFRLSPILILGFSLGALIVGSLVAFLLGLQVPIPQTGIPSYVFDTFLLVCLLGGFLLIPRENAIKEMTFIDEYYPAPVIDHGPDSRGLLDMINNDPAQQDDANEVKGGGRFMRRLEKVANIYLLSNREIEVFYLLAKGRKAASIAENLFISEGTVHTHTWHIYRKLSVHSQQELMDLVDKTELEDEN